MKLSLPTQFMLTALMCISCGKKEGENSSKSVSKIVEAPASERTFVAQTELRRAVVANDTMALRKVIFDNSDINLNVTLASGDTLLAHSIKNRLHLIRRILLEKGAQPDQVGNNPEAPGQTPLMIAAHMGDISAINSLLEYRASKNIQDVIGDTALHKAIHNGYDEAARTLIRAGASLQIENDRRESPLQLALRLNRKDVAELLQGLVNIERGAPTLAAFRQMIADGDIINYRKLVTRYPNVIKEYETINPLYLAIDSNNDLNNLEIAQSLIALGVNVNGIQEATSSPLIRAVELKKKTLIELLLNSNADINLGDSEGRPPLYFAIASNDYNMVDYLMSNGATQSTDMVVRSRKLRFRGCRLAGQVHRKQTTPEGVAEIKKIISRLNCGWL